MGLQGLIFFSIEFFYSVIQGPEDTPYEEGYFKLEINIPDRLNYYVI